MSEISILHLEDDLKTGFHVIESDGELVLHTTSYTNPEGLLVDTAVKIARPDIEKIIDALVSHLVGFKAATVAVDPTALNQPPIVVTAEGSAAIIKTVAEAQPPAPAEAPAPSGLIVPPSAVVTPEPAPAPAPEPAPIAEPAVVSPVSPAPAEAPVPEPAVVPAAAPAPDGVPPVVA